MKFLVRWAFRFGILLVVLVVAALLLKDPLAKSFLEHRLRRATGMDAAITRLDLGILTPTLTIEGLRLYNPTQFGPTTFLDLPELRIEYDPRALVAGRVMLRTVRLHLRELTVVEDRTGRQNTEALHAHLQGDAGPGRTWPQAGLRFDGIGTLALTAGRVRYVSLRDPSRNWERQFTLRNATLHNLRSGSELITALVQLCVQNGFGSIRVPDPRR